ncbi:MAG: hypothetical protein WKG00_38860 [Polyangiaceae bacterium]
MKPWTKLLLGSMISLSCACATGPDPAEGEHVAFDETGVAPGEPPPLACGGLLGLGCPEKYECVDDWRDECDPEQGGADCSGLCEHVDGGAACAPFTPLCGTGEVCVDGRHDLPCVPPADDTPPQCLTGTCVAADCGLIPPYDPSVLDCANTPVRCAPGYFTHEDACGCSCVPACDPTLLCGDALTCVNGDLYPTTCGPANCDLPIGACKAYP